MGYEFCISDGYSSVWRIWFGISNVDCNGLVASGFDMSTFTTSMRSQLASVMNVDAERIYYVTVRTGRYFT